MQKQKKCVRMKEERTGEQEKKKKNNRADTCMESPYSPLQLYLPFSSASPTPSSLYPTPPSWQLWTRSLTNNVSLDKIKKHVWDRIRVKNKTDSRYPSRAHTFPSSSLYLPSSQPPMLSLSPMQHFLGCPSLLTLSLFTLHLLPINNNNKKKSHIWWLGKRRCWILHCKLILECLKFRFQICLT